MINIKDILILHKTILNKYGGLDGIKDKSLLQSSIDGIYQTFDGNDLYPSILDKIVRLSYNIIRNHPFNDGNKRIGFFILVNLLTLNKIKFDIDVILKEGSSIILDLASNKIDYDKYLNWVKSIIK